VDVANAGHVRQQHQRAAVVGGRMAGRHHVGREAGESVQVADLEALTDRQAGRGEAHSGGREVTGGAGGAGQNRWGDGCLRKEVLCGCTAAKMCLQTVVGAVRFVSECE